MSLQGGRWFVCICVIVMFGCGQADDPAAYQARLVARFADHAAIGWNGLASAGLGKAPLGDSGSKTGLFGDGVEELEYKSKAEEIAAILEKLFPSVDKKSVDKERSRVRHAVAKMRLGSLSKLGSFGHLARERLQKLGDDATVMLRELHKAGEDEPGVAVEAVDIKGKSRLVAQVFPWRWRVRVHWSLGLHHALLARWQPKGDGKLQNVQLLLNGEEVDLAYWDQALKYVQAHESMRQQLWLTWTATLAAKSKETCGGNPVCVQLELADPGSGRLRAWYRESKHGSVTQKGAQWENKHRRQQQKETQKLMDRVARAQKQLELFKTKRDVLKQQSRSFSSTNQALAVRTRPDSALLAQLQNDLRLAQDRERQATNALSGMQTQLESARRRNAVAWMSGDEQRQRSRLRENYLHDQNQRINQAIYTLKIQNAMIQQKALKEKVEMMQNQIIKEELYEENVLSILKKIKLLTERNNSLQKQLLQFDTENQELRKTDETAKKLRITNNELLKKVQKLTERNEILREEPITRISGLQQQNERLVKKIKALRSGRHKMQQSQKELLKFTMGVITDGRKFETDRRNKDVKTNKIFIEKTKETTQDLWKKIQDLREQNHDLKKDGRSLSFAMEWVYDRISKKLRSVDRFVFTPRYSPRLVDYSSVKIIKEVKSPLPVIEDHQETDNSSNNRSKENDKETMNKLSLLRIDTSKSTVSTPYSGISSPTGSVWDWADRSPVGQDEVDLVDREEYRSEDLATKTKFLRAAADKLVKVVHNLQMENRRLLRQLKTHDKKAFNFPRPKLEKDLTSVSSKKDTQDENDEEEIFDSNTPRLENEGLD